jgi:hypothetical protein
MDTPENTSTALVPQPSSLPVPAAPQSPPIPKPTEPDNRRKGKIARLPKATRDKINTMLQDGVPYLEIIDRLGPEGHGLIEKNLSNWKSGGYMDWLRGCQLAEAIQIKYEIAQDIIANSTESTGPGRAVLHILATNLCQFLAETDPSELRESLLSDADKFTKFVNAMVRLAEGGIKCELHKFHTDDRTAQIAKQNRASDEQPGISDESLQKAEQKLKLL